MSWLSAFGEPVVVRLGATLGALHKPFLYGKFPRDPMGFIWSTIISVYSDFREFRREFVGYLVRALRICGVYAEAGKKVFVTRLYRQRGRYVKRFVHSGMAGITALGVMIAPIVAQEFPGATVDPWAAQSPLSVLSVSATDTTQTVIANQQFRSEIVEYVVQEGDTISTIAQKFDIDSDTVKWQNDLTSDNIKPGQTLEILPVPGISHKVAKGETVHAIAKKYDVEPQNIVNYPFNSYVNDETFELAIGQTLIVPEGIKPSVAPSSPRRQRQITPDAGTVVASGSFVWPAQGRITQNFIWYHPGIDIANKQAPNILAADSGTVIVAGWPDNYGYGNRVIIDHGNGMRTLYAHLSRVFVATGQAVNRGAALGQMGSTGRSTGTHLHFEVLRNGVQISPLSVLQ